MIWLRIGAIFGFVAVVAGAFGAHGLGDHFEKVYKDVPPKTVMGKEIPATEKYFNDYKTAAEYQMIHSLALVVVGVLSLFWTGCPRAVNAAGICFTTGILLFSGSLYLLSLYHLPKLGMVTPIGGLFLLAGWISLACVGIGPSGMKQCSVKTEAT